MMNELIKQLQEFAVNANDLNRELTEKFIKDITEMDTENNRLIEANSKIENLLNK